jgi:hypothetical protein
MVRIGDDDDPMETSGVAMCTDEWDVSMDTGEGHVKATMEALFEELREVMQQEVNDGGISLISLTPTLELT